MKYNVQNLHCLSKNSTLISRKNCRFIGGEKLVKMLWLWTFLLLTTLISREKLSKNIWVKNSWKCCGFVKIEFFGQKIDFSKSLMRLLEKIFVRLMTEISTSRNQEKLKKIAFALCGIPHANLRVVFQIWKIFLQLWSIAKKVKEACPI